jgi:hypothetical protein
MSDTPQRVRGGEILVGEKMLHGMVLGTSPVARRVRHMVLENIERVQAYTALISQDILARYDGVVRVWDTPRSAIDGGQVVDKITQPLEVVVHEEEKDLYGSLPQRARIRYGDGKEGWVLYQMITRVR